MTCSGRSYRTHRQAADAVRSGAAPAAFDCRRCDGWHLGEDGRIRRCQHCGRVVFWRSKHLLGQGRRKALKPTDPDTGEVHNLEACRRAA